jgi:hypothetical protein
LCQKARDFEQSLAKSGLIEEKPFIQKNQPPPQFDCLLGITIPPITTTWLKGTHTAPMFEDALRLHKLSDAISLSTTTGHRLPL